MGLNENIDDYMAPHEFLADGVYWVFDNLPAEVRDKYNNNSDEFVRHLMNDPQAWDKYFEMWTKRRLPLN